MHGGGGERDEDSSSAFPLLPFSFPPSLLCLVHLHFLLLLLLCSALPPTHSVVISPGDRIALLELKNVLNPELRKGIVDWWGKEEEDPCRWGGVRCRSRRVFHLNVTGPCPLKAACAPLDPLPLSIGRLTQLRQLSLPCHGFPGPIPVEIASLKHLRVLDLHGNALHGPIPSALGRLHHLRFLNLAGNHLAGKIPPALSACQSLQVLNLAGNMLSGELPAFIGKLHHLEILSIAHNQLHGSVLTEIMMEGSHRSSLKHPNLKGNSLTSSIPHTSGNCLQLQSSILASNSLANRICTSLAQLSELQPTKMNKHGNLGREIPLELRKHGSLSLLTPPNPVYYQSSPPCCFPIPSVALRQLEEIELPFMRSRRLLGPKKHDHFSSVKIAAIAGGCTILLVLIIILCLVRQTKRHFSGVSGNSGGRKEVVTFEKVSFNVGYDNIVKATGNFSVDNLIGSGGFGATYKAELLPGTLVAVKRLSRGKFHGVKQFDAEIRTLGRVRHPNLVTLVGYHASESEMFLIYNYLPGGNLESLIHENGRTRGLVSWRIRYKIALDIAHALAYLHHECTPRVLHRDIKPSNILLDNSQNAYLSDFGLARLLGASETHATTDVAGTFGYVAPEYAMTSRVSDKADVYSYGVVLLELLSGKRALDSSFSRYSDGFNIVAWAHHLLERGRAGELFAPGLWDQGPHPELVDVLKLAVNCTVDALPKRPSMRQVVDWLKRSRLLSSF